MTMPRTALVLTAGFGTRMAPLTNTTPKPLLPVAGKPILAYILDNLKREGIKKVFLNTHHLADKIVAFAKSYPAEGMEIELVHEPEILDTGGAVTNILLRIDEDVFYVVHGDAFWQDGPEPTLQRLANAWQGDLMDVLLLLYPTARLNVQMGPEQRHYSGDFHRINDAGQLQRPPKGERAAWMFAGLRLFHRRAFKGWPVKLFSQNAIFDEAATKGRLYGLPHTGQWYHLSTPPDLDRTAEQLYT